MASAVDAGEELDIHPQDKKTVGFRLALDALCNVYQVCQQPGEGPRYERYSTCGDKIRLEFSYAQGLCLKGDKPERAFVVAGIDGVFKPADYVEVQGAAILVASSKVPRPRAVRYAWSDNPVSSIYNEAGLPASPFRTDKWVLLK